LKKKKKKEVEDILQFLPKLTEALTPTRAPVSQLLGSASQVTKWCQWWLDVCKNYVK
jgi:hypothetical protein